MNLNLINKNIVIFGGSYGIGLSIAKGFLSEHANVHIISRSFESENIKLLNSQFPNSNLFYYKCDATKQV